MQLPAYLRNAIERRAHGLPLSVISQASARLSAAYRQSAVGAIASDVDRIAYVVTRLPSTYAATRAVVLDVCGRLAGVSIESILDLGAGPGTATHAALDVFPDVRKVTLIEQDRGWIDFGKSLGQESPHPAMRSAVWETHDLSKAQSLDSHDLVLLSYMAGELDESHLLEVLRMAWNAARYALAIIEPGTPRAFSRLRFMREVLLHDGAHMIAPCPHGGACPMANHNDDWCHFAARVERGSLHRRAKGGTLGYEDEKYSYVAVSRLPVVLPSARIIRRPIHTSGSVVLSLCTQQGLQAEAATRGNRSDFRRAKKALWGEAWESDSLMAHLPGDESIQHLSTAKGIQKNRQGGAGQSAKSVASQRAAVVPPGAKAPGKVHLV